MAGFLGFWVLGLVFWVLGVCGLELRVWGLGPWDSRVFQNPRHIPDPRFGHVEIESVPGFLLSAVGWGARYSLISTNHRLGRLRHLPNRDFALLGTPSTTPTESSATRAGREAARAARSGFWQARDLCARLC